MLAMPGCTEAPCWYIAWLPLVDAAAVDIVGTASMVVDEEYSASWDILNKK